MLKSCPYFIKLSKVNKLIQNKSFSLNVISKIISYILQCIFLILPRELLKKFINNLVTTKRNSY